jgi:hypothetical protein
VAEDEPSGVTLVNDVGPPARHRLRPATVRALARCDGRTTIRETVASTDGKDQNTVRDEIRDLIAAGTLVSGAAALGRPTTVLTRAVCGLTVAVEIAEDSATEMARLLPGAAAPTETAADWTWRLHPNAARARPYTYPPDHPTYIADDLRPVAEDIHDWVAANAQERVLVRAAVAASGTDAIVLTGEDAQLRASIALALAGRGAIIYSTRFAVLDRHGAVEPYLTGETNAAGYPSARPRVFAALSTGDAWDVAERGAGQTALSLVANAPRSRTRPAETLAAVRAALDGATPIDGSCGLPEDAASHLLDMLGAQRHHDSP